MTTELYWQDSYLRSALARVQSVVDPFHVVLDQSIFYPQGGGQPFDLGIIVRKQIICVGTEMTEHTASFQVKGVKRSGADIILEVDKPGLQAGDAVSCELDWQRRWALMRMHSAAHVLAKVIFNATGSLITGNQLDVQQSRMDFNVGAFSREIAEGFVQQANRVIELHLSITAEFVKYEVAIQRPELFRLKDVLPKNVPELRIVSIGDFDVQADGGTHVRNTSEIGQLVLERIENKGKENRRLYWVLK